MPRKKTNKSQVIRDMIAATPNATSKEIVGLLAEKGTKVSANLVYLVKSKAGAKRRKIKREKAAEAGRTAGIVNPVELIREVKQLAVKSGGMRNLKQLIEILS